MSRNRRLAYLALLYNAVVWGAAFPIVKPAFDYATPTQYLFFRYLVAGLVSLPLFVSYYAKKRPSIKTLATPWALEVAGLALPILLLYHGLSKTSALEASLIGATGPLFVIVGGILFLGEHESRRERQGLILSLLGSLILVAEPLWNGASFIGSGLTGNLLILLYNLVWTVYALFAKRIYGRKPPLALVSLTYLTTAAVHGLILSAQNMFPSLSLLFTNYSTLIAVLYMAIPGGIIANIFYLYAASRIEVSEANLFTYLNGIVAIPVSYLLLGESPSHTALLAVALIAYGVYRAEVRHK